MILIIFIFNLSSCTMGIATSYNQDLQIKKKPDVSSLSDYDVCYLSLNSVSMEMPFGPKLMWGSKEQKIYIQEAKKRGMTCGVAVERKINTKKVSLWKNIEICDAMKARQRNSTSYINDVLTKEATSRNICGFTSTVSKTNKTKKTLTLQNIIEKYDEAVALYVDKDYKKAFIVFENLASEGYNNAQYYLANMYAEAQGVEKNIYKAKDLWSLAAKDNHRDSLFNLGHLYYYGDSNINIDYEKAYYYFNRSSQLYDGPSQNYLGQIYEKAQGKKQNNILALMWYELAIRNKSVYAHQNKKLIKKFFNKEQLATVKSFTEICQNQKYNNCSFKKLEIASKQKPLIKKVNSDNKKPIINSFVKQNGSKATISGRVTDNIDLAEVSMNGEQLSITSEGSFETELYVPRNGLNVEIVAFDRKGNKATKLHKLQRDALAETSGPTFDSLNPLGKRVKSNPNALALIIGVADYEKTNADALYADKDAQQFYDYAQMKLGVPTNKIKELVNDKADLGEIGLAVQDWIARSTKKDKSDIYIFFAGHGLASDDGKDMYLLPYDGRPRLLNKTALLRDELFKEIQQSNPRSVTVFLDTCYSGTTRGTDMLVASRPIMIKAKQQSIPNNFTVFSAAAGDQTSKPLEEAKHGMFSYFLMKGMEGDADTNNDNKITARELHAYVEQNVVQQSSGSQTPELQGDKDRVLVQFN